MLAACRAAGASAWYVADDYLTLGPELSANPGSPFADTAGITAFTSGVLSVVNGALRSGTAAGSSQPMIANFAVPTTPGKNYKVSVPRASKTSQVGVFTLQASNNSTGSGSFASANYGAFGAATNGLMEFVFTATAAMTYVGLRADSGAAGTSADYSEWFGCSVREVISAKDFQDSIGTLPANLANSVGMMFDASGSVGIEKNTLPLSSWTLPAGFTADGSTIVCASASTSLSCYGTLGLASGKAHLITYTISEYSSGSIRPIASSGVVGAVRSANGTFTEIITPSSGAGNFGFQPWTTNFTGKITVNSVREVSGNHVMQATAGNRPLVSRIPRKLGPELLSGVSISGTNGTNTGSATANSFTINQVDTSSVVGATLFMSAIPAAGKSYYITSTPSGLSGSGFKVDNPAWTPNGVQFNAGVVLAATSIPSASIYVYRNGTPTAGTFSNISVREVLEWSYALTFDGSNDSLAAASSIIGATLTQPHTMIAWGRPGAIGAFRRMVGDGVRALGVESSGKASVFHNGTGAIVGTTTLTAGQAIVLEETWDGATAKLYLNGALENSSALAAPTGTPAATAIGQTGSASSYWIGDSGGVIVCPAVMTDAQRAAVRKFAAAQMGLAL